jgi:hypothetical protein
VDSIIGTWRLVSETAWNSSGQPEPTFYGPMPIGIAVFTATGRMMASFCDGRPNPIDGPRAFSAFCGTYTFDGTRMVYEVEEATRPDYRGSTQVRDARFDGNHLILRLPVGFRGATDVTRELTWERIA